MDRRKKIKVGVRPKMRRHAHHKVPLGASLLSARNDLTLKVQSSFARAKQAEQAYNQSKAAVGRKAKASKELKRKLIKDNDEYMRYGSARDDAHEKYMKTRRAAKTLFPIPFQPVL
jgi:hypothetical protein